MNPHIIRFLDSSSGWAKGLVRRTTEGRVQNSDSIKSTTTLSTDHKLRPRAVAIGNFDGVHRGHRDLLETLKKSCCDGSFTSSVLTFYPHPLVFFSRQNNRVFDNSVSNTHIVDAKLKKSPIPILSFSEKVRRLHATGIDEIILQNFNAQFSKISPELFIEDYLAKTLNVKHICVGENFRFGYQRRGDVALLARVGQKFGMTVHPANLYEFNQTVVSSGHIRQKLIDGDLLGANQLLVAPFCVTGRVIHGAKLGTQMGIPTLNISMPVNNLGQAVLSGIFFVKIHGLGKQFFGVASVGSRPSVEENGSVLLEVHVFDFQQNCYGKRVSVEFVKKWREEEKFDNISKLMEVMNNDIFQAKQFFTSGDR